MERIGKTESAYKKFKEAAIKHAEATEMGNYEIANKCYCVIADNARYLKDTNNLELLSELLKSEYVGVRMWAATYLLPVCEHEAIHILQAIADGDNIHSLTAKTTIDEWINGNLEL